MTADKSPGFFLNAQNRQWEVAQFTLTNWGISREYALELTIPNAELPSLLNQAACLTFGDHVFHGFITAHHSAHSDKHQISNLQLVSPLTYYLSHYHTRIYKSESLTSIIRQVLSEAGLQEGIDFILKMNLKKKQWWFNEINQPGLVFLNRLLGENKLYYAYRQTSDQAQCVFSDSLDALLPDDALSLPLTSNSGFAMQESISKWSSKARLSPEKPSAKALMGKRANIRMVNQSLFVNKN